GVTLTKVGEQSVTATDTVTATITGAQSAITVTPATATHFSVAGITDPVVAGSASDVTVTALDAYDNTDTNYASTAHFTSSDTNAATVLPGGAPRNYSFSAPDACTTPFAAGVTLTKVGEQSVTATDTVTATITGAQ